MPEGDAVLRTARRLDRALQGKTLTASDFRVPALATADLAGVLVEGTATHGKHLLTRLVGDARWTLHTHLKMEGSWRVFDHGRRWSRPAHEARVVLRTADLSAVGFALGVVELLPTAEEHAVVGHLGPDLLGPGWDADVAVRRLLEEPGRALGEALLDQTRLAGMGTIYVAETCFITGNHPQRTVGSVPDLRRLVERARQLLEYGARQGRPVSTGDVRNPMWVYRRQQQPCRRCGTTIEAGQLGGAGRERTTYWCPRCQPPG